MNRDLLQGFIGSARYLADDIYVPMGVLSAITGDSVPFRWDHTEQRAFNQVKHYVQAWAGHRRVPLVYGEGRRRFNLVHDRRLHKRRSRRDRARKGLEDGSRCGLPQREDDWHPIKLSRP
jgi:hypothetical protein